MPIMLRVEELEPGMVLANSVMNEFCVLLAHGRKLNEFDIRALERKLPEVMVQVVDPVLDEMVDFQNDSHDREVSLEVRRNIGTVTKKVSQQVRMGVALDADNVAGMQKVIEEMMAYLQDNPVTMAVIEQSGDWNDYLQEHSANVFYLSLVIGNTLRNYVKQERERLSAAKTPTTPTMKPLIASTPIWFGPILAWIPGIATRRGAWSRLCPGGSPIIGA